MGSKPLFEGKIAPLSAGEKAPGETKYAKLEQALRAQIETIRAEAGNCLPTERELCERYQVSRVTVRRALEELEKAGLIYRVQGKGAFLCKEKIRQPLSYLSSFSEDMKAGGMVSGAKVLALEVVSAPAHVAEYLRVAEGAAIVLLKRLRLADGRPIAIETCYMDHAIGSVIMQHMADDVSLYELMAAKCSVKPAWANQNIEVGLLQPWEQTLLGEDAPSYALCMKRQTMDEAGRILEFTQSKYRGDSYSYHVTFSIKAE